MPKIRVLVVDDAVVIRKLITETLRADPDLEVVGAAANGKIALQKITQLTPDLLTLDVEMPEMDGLATLREVRKLYPKLAVIMFSTLTQKGAVSTLEALSLGANDYVTKPANVGSVTEGMERLKQELIPKIKVHCRHVRTASSLRESEPAAVSAPLIIPLLPPRAGPIDIVCIGTSTGGPNALAEVFASLPAAFPVPIVIVQHMPPLFTAMLAERLSLILPSCATKVPKARSSRLVMLTSRPGEGTWKCNAREPGPCCTFRTGPRRIHAAPPWMCSSAVWPRFMAARSWASS